MVRLAISVSTMEGATKVTSPAPPRASSVASDPQETVKRPDASATKPIERLPGGLRSWISGRPFNPAARKRNNGPGSPRPDHHALWPTFDCDPQPERAGKPR